jgi:RHS repeat-associated protein
LGDTTQTTYDQAGRATATSGPYGSTAYTYNSDDQLATSGFGGTTLATPSYSDTTSGLETGVSYNGNGTTLANGWDTYGRPDQITFDQASTSVLLEDADVMDVAGLVTSDTQTDPTGSWTDTYGYDNAARLTSATAPGNTYSYSYASTGGCGALTEAGLNSDRTSSTDNSTTTTYCYGDADQLTSTTLANHGSITYDTDGNTTAVGPDTFTYDGDNRNLTITDGSTTVSYTRDADDRVLDYKVTTSGTVTTSIEYGYADDSDTPVWTDNLLTSQTQDLVGLPGGVIATVSTLSGTTTTTWAYSDLHGDTVATANNSGAKTGSTTLYDPFGNPLTTEQPAGTGNNTDGYEGDHQIETNTDTPLTLQQMGARIYDPTTGRFYQLDPIPGGSANQYDYTNQNPVTASDLTGDGAYPSGPRCSPQRESLCPGHGWHPGKWAGRTAHDVGRGVEAGGRAAWNHRGAISTVAAFGVCVSVVASPLCVAAQMGALALRVQQRGVTHYSANAVDAAATVVAIGYSYPGEESLAGQPWPVQALYYSPIAVLGLLSLAG